VQIRIRWDLGSGFFLSCARGRNWALPAIQPDERRLFNAFNNLNNAKAMLLSAVAPNRPNDTSVCPH